MFANVLNCSFNYSAAKKTGIKLCLMCNDVLNIPISMKLCWRVNTQKLEYNQTTQGRARETHKKIDAGKEMQSSSGKKEAERVKMEKVSVADGQGK